MRQAAFKALASLGANDEDIRKKVCFKYNVIIHNIEWMGNSQYWWILLDVKVFLYV